MPGRKPVRRLLRAAAAVRPRRRIRLDNDERRAQLLQLARKAFSDRSYDDVSIDDLAREAKISKGLLYHYFPTKRDLYVAGLREIAEELVQRVLTIPPDLAPIERVRAGIEAYLDHISQHSRAYVSLMRGGIGSDPEVAAVVEGVRKRLADNFLEQTPFAQMLSKDVRFQTAVRGWIGFVEGATIDWCANPRLSRDDLRELLTTILFSIITAVAPQLIKDNIR
ncbi:MAG TPA: TetR/AcrR family transcriptional regulator [Kofleriaceae bacterium]|nr:TetR/AcrR family transcriptional regulator [Kofleriaceae bacterium]